MQPIIYDVAVSIDGFISGPGGDISGFAQEGQVVNDYMDRLATYATAIMGRETYEFGYRFGMAPGQNPYEHMTTHVFSQSIVLPENKDVRLHGTSDADQIRKIRIASDGPVYLCGGGAFAGSLLRQGLIDLLRLKRAPILLGCGVRLFGDDAIAPALCHVHTTLHDNGYAFQEFKVVR